jgi:hypothetical protein
MYYEWPEVGAIALLWATACIPAWLVHRRRQDIFDPRVFYPCFYAYMTTGPCLFKILKAGSYHPGLKVDLLAPVLLSCCTAVGGFSLAASMALRRWPHRRPGQILVRSPISPRYRASNALLREIAILGAAVSIASYGYFSFKLQAQTVSVAGDGKAHIIANADEELLRQFYFFAAAASASLTLAVIADACVSRTAFSPMILGLLLAEFAACAYSGERDILLVGGVWCVANWSKLSRPQIAISASALVVWLGVSPVLRAVDLGFGNQIAAVKYFTMEDWLYSVTHFAPNVHVFTNVVDQVPAVDPFWYGSSIIDTLSSFLPGNLALNELTPAGWFRDVYDMQRVAGYAFSQDAEAYLNFGWIGPPLWFAAWGYLLGGVYRRATRPGARLIDVFVWWFAVATWLFGVRSDSRTILKMLIVGVAAATWLSWLAHSWTNRGRTRIASTPEAKQHWF